MSWLIRICQSKPMALPFALPEQRYEDGLNRIDRMMTDETAKSEAETMQPSYLGSGMYGTATNLPSGFAGKYTDDPSEVEIARRVKDNPISCIVNVHNIRQVQRDPIIFMIIMEKVKVLDAIEKEAIRMLRHDWEKQEEVEGARQTYKNKMQLIDDYIDLRRCLIANKISGDDAHWENIGYNKQGNLVLFDLENTI